MIGALLETILLLINAIAILNEKRFLKKRIFPPIQMASARSQHRTVPMKKSLPNRR